MAAPIEEGMDDLNEEDMVEVIDVEGTAAEDLDEQIGDLDMVDYEEDGDENEAETEEEPVSDEADVTFSRHSSSVFACDINAAGNLSVTGGEDDRAFVWNTGSGEFLFECGGHKDSVTCVAFSHDDSLVATGDMSGLVKVWDVAKKEEIWSFECSDLEWLFWHHSSHLLLAGTSEGEVWMWKIPSGEFKTMQGHGCQATAGKLSPNGKQCWVGYEDGVLKQWDLKQTRPALSLPHCHSGTLTCLDCHPNGALVLSGSADGTANLVNVGSGKVIATYQGDARGVEEDREGDRPSVECVGLSPSQPLAAIGALSGALSIWDIPTQKMRQLCSHQAGVVRLQWDRYSPLVHTASLDGVLRQWDTRSGKVTTSWTGHRGEILDMAVSRDSNTIVTTSEDKTAKVFIVNRPER